MPKRIKTKKGNVVEFNDYISMLKNQYKMLMAEEKIDTAAARKVQDTYYALLLWNGEDNEISEADLDNVVKQSKGKNVNRQPYADAVQQIKRKEAALEKDQNVPYYLKKIWPYYYATLDTNTKEIYNQFIGKYNVDGVGGRANIISNLCDSILKIRDEALVPKTEEEARRTILSNWALLHAGAEITNLLEDLSCEYDIVDIEDYKNDKKAKEDKAKGNSDNIKVPYRGYTCTEKVEKRKFPPKGPFLAALKHKQKLINNLLIYEKKWKAEAEPVKMEASDWEVVNYDEAPSAQYDNAKIYRHNFVQNERGRILSYLKDSGVTVEDAFAVVKDRLAFEMLDKAYPDGIPEDLDAEKRIKELGDSIPEEQLYAEVLKYAKQVAIEDKDAANKYELQNAESVVGMIHRDVDEIKRVGKEMDEFVRGERQIGDSSHGYSHGDGTFAFKEALLCLAPYKREITSLDAINTVDILGRFVKLYKENVDKIYPDEEALEKFAELTKIFKEIKEDAQKILDKNDLKTFNQNIDESLEDVNECVKLATARKDLLEEEERKQREEEERLRAERIKEQEEREAFQDNKDDREMSFAESDEKINKTYKSIGITASDLRKEALADEERVEEVREHSGKEHDVKIAQRWGHDPLRNSDDPGSWNDPTNEEAMQEKATVMAQRMKKLRWKDASLDLEVAQVSILGLPAEAFPGEGSAYENKLKFLTNFISDPDFKNKSDVKEFVEKAHITFEQVRAEALGAKPKAEALMSMYGEAMQTIASLSVYNHNDPTIAPALHEAADTINIKLFASGSSASDPRAQAEYQKFTKAILTNSNNPFSKEFIKAANYMQQSLELNAVKENELIAKSKIINNTCESPKELRAMYADFIASKIVSIVIENDKKHCLSSGELQSPSLKLLGHEDFRERLVKSIKQTDAFKEMCKKDITEIRECVMFKEKPLKEMAGAILKDVTKTFKQSELDDAMIGARMTEKVKAPKANKKSEKTQEALVPLH